MDLSWDYLTVLSLESALSWWLLIAIVLLLGQLMSKPETPGELAEMVVHALAWPIIVIYVLIHIAFGWRN